MGADPSRSKSLQVNQALHGYSDGHRLIASSTKLSKEGSRALLVLTDLSGPPSVGFDSYITGYPLPEDDQYAVARTWINRESDRPGTVWSHTLLVAYSELATIDHLSSLMGLFKYPEKFEESEYDTPLYLPKESPFSLDSASPKADDILRQLYSSDVTENHALIMPADDSEEYDRLVMSIWSQQWPQLRQKFSFCTGSLAFRRLPTGEAFIFQISPADRARLIGRAENATVLDRATPDTAQPDWSATAAADMSSMEIGEFRKFLWRNATDLYPDSRSYRKLAETYQLAYVQRGGPYSIADLIADRFPLAESAVTLKRWFFGYPSHDWEPSPEPREFHALSAMLMANPSSAYHSSRLNVGATTQQLIESSRVMAVRLVSQLPDPASDRIATLILDKVADELLPAEFAELCETRNDLISALLRRRRDLIAYPHIWRTSESTVRSVMIKLSTELGEVNIPNLAEGILGSHNLNAALVASELYRDKFVFALLDLVDETDDSEKVASDSWDRIWRQNTTAVLQWLGRGSSPQPSTLEQLLQALDSNSTEVLNRGSEYWLHLAPPKSESLGYGATRAFLLDVAFGISSAGGASLASAVFQGVLNAAQSAVDDHHSGQVRLPANSKSFRDPDGSGINRAQYALINTLVDRFSNHSWPAATLPLCFDDAAALAYALDLWGESESGRAALQQLGYEIIRQGNSKRLGYEEFQIKLVRSAAQKASRARRRFQDFRLRKFRARSEKPVYPDDLSRREVDVLRMIAAGKSNQQIAEELAVTERTVHRHVANIFGKTKLIHRQDAFSYVSAHDLADDHREDVSWRARPGRDAHD